jgi:hypothetical protein
MWRRGEGTMTRKKETIRTQVHPLDVSPDIILWGTIANGLGFRRDS